MACQDSSIGKPSEIISISQAINHLCVSLYHELSKEKNNLFFSPLSVSSALSMLFCGSQDFTSKEMRYVLGFDEAAISDADVEHCFKQLITTLEKSADCYTLTSANVVFSHCDFSIKEEFKSLLMKSFKAMTLEVDFLTESAKATQLANDWVKEKTNGMIPQLLDSLDPSTVMVILNAVYFKGFWMHKFKKEATYLQSFYNKGLENSEKKVEMMHLKESFPYIEVETFKALELPYKGDEIAMLILLPNSRNGLGDLEAKFSIDFISELKNKLLKTDVNVALPKFRLEYMKSLKSNFQNLGMTSVFQSGANFDTISDSRNLVVSEILHKAVLEVNEEGSEAAAATAVVMMLCSLRFDPDFIADHPFLFVIYNNVTNLILFMGRVEEL